MAGSALAPRLSPAPRLPVAALLAAPELRLLGIPVAAAWFAPAGLTTPPPALALAGDTASSASSVTPADLAAAVTHDCVLRHPSPAAGRPLPPGTAATEAPPLALHPTDAHLGPVIAASSVQFVPLSVTDGLVAGVTVDEVLVDRLGAELPGSLFHAPHSRWVFDVAEGALLTASAVGDRAQVTWTGRPSRGGARDGGGAAGGAEANVASAGREAALDWRVVSWQRPRWRGDGVLAADPVSMLLHPSTGGGGGGAAPARVPPPAVGGDPVGAWHRFMDSLLGWFGNASIAARDGGALSRAGVPPTAPAPARVAPVTTISHTEASSYCVVRRLGAVALGAAPVRAARLRLPPPDDRGGGGGGAAAPTDGAARGARRRPVRRRRGPIPVDTVDDPVVRDRVLRNRESARRSNERRRAATAAARSAVATATTASAAASVVAARVGSAAPRGGGAAALAPRP